MKKILLLAAAVATTLTAMAEGYQVNNFSARQTGMANVGAAMKLGSESIYFNPAATAFQQSTFNASIGATGILSYASATELPTLANGYRPGKTEHSDNKMSTPLHVYLNYKPLDRLSVGLGFYTPNGSGVNWGDDWSGAHLVQSINLKAFTFQPTLSWKICDNLSIGAGLMVTWGSFDLSRSMLSAGKRAGLIAGMIDPAIAQLTGAIAQLPDGAQKEQMTAQLGQLEGAKGYLNSTMDRSLVSAKLEGSSKMAYGVNVGILWDVNAKWSLAMTWRSRMNMKVSDGTAALDIDPTAAALIQQLGALSPGTELLPPLDKGTFRAELPLPTTVTWGVSFRPTERWQLAVDLQWTGWSAYKELNVSFNEKELGIKDIYSVKNYSNSVSGRFGAEYRALDWLSARMGIYFDESPVDSNYLNPETPSMTKLSYSAGLSFDFSRRVVLDLAYCYVTSADPERTGSYPLYDYHTGQLEEVFTRNYKLHAHVLSFGLRLNF